VTEVEFVRVEGPLQGALAATCDLIDAAIRSRHDILVLLTGESRHRDLALQLGHYCDAARLPWSDDPDQADSICITRANRPGRHHSLLINFSDRIPGWHGRFEKLVEILYDDQPDLDKRRNHYRFFRDRGYPLRFRQINA